MTIKIYVENKCYQCWLCKKRVGSDHHGLPECKVTDKYMYEVYEEPCHYFEPTERVKNLIMKSTDVAEENKRNMISFTERFRAYKLFTRWAEKNRATKDAISVIAWLLPVIDEDKFKEFIKDQEKELLTESKKEGDKNEN